MDDAYHYLESRKLKGSHNTSLTPLAMYSQATPVQSGNARDDPDELIDGSNATVTSQSNGNTDLHPQGAVNGHANGNSNGHANGTINGHINGTSSGHVNGTSNGNLNGGRNGNHSTLDQEDAHTNPTTNGQGENTSKRRHRVFIWSTHEEALGSKSAADYAQHLADRVEPDEEQFLDNLAHTLTNRRSMLPWKSYIVASSHADLVEQVSTTRQKAVRARALGSGEPRLAFVFTGQGAQWFAMGRELHEYPVFSEAMARADRELAALGADWSLLEELAKNKAESLINQPHISQPACTMIQIALVDLYRSWGVKPIKVIGHSSGEIAAAYAAGILPLSSAVRIAYYRGIYSSLVKLRLPEKKGAMLAVGLSPQEASDGLQSLDRSLGKAVVACINSPSNVTLSGDRAALEAVVDAVSKDNVFARFLQIDTAYHSHHMQAVAEDYKASMGDMDICRIDPGVEMISTVTGKRVENSQILGAEYWTANMVSCVRFSQGLETLCTSTSSSTKADGTVSLGSKAAVDVLVEIGPHSALAGPIKQVLAVPSLEKSGIIYKSALVRNENACKTALETAAYLFAAGFSIDINALNFPNPPISAPSVLVDLPGYFWNHSKRHWCESRLSLEHRFRRHGRSDFLGYPVNDWNPSEPRWRNIVKLKEQPWLKGHQVQGAYVYPATGFVVMAVEALRKLHDMPEYESRGSIKGLQIRDLEIPRALIVPSTEEGIETIFSMKPYKETSVSFSNKWYEFKVFSYSNAHNEWSEHAYGLISAIDGDGPILDQQQYLDDRHAVEECGTPRTQSGETIYKDFNNAGLVYVNPFQNILTVASGEKGAVGIVEIPDTKSLMPLECESEHLAHPAVLDNFVQLLFPALSYGATGPQTPYVPVSFENITIDAGVTRTPKHRFQVLSSANISGYRQVTADIFVANEEDSNPVMRMSGVKCAALSGGSGDQSSGESAAKKLCFHTEWDADADLLPKELADERLRKTIVQPSDPRRVADMETLSWYYYALTLEAVSEEHTGSMPTHLLKMYRYIQHQQDLVMADKVPHQTPEWKTITSPESRQKMEELAARISQTGSDGVLLCRVGPKLPQILTGQVDPLALMLQDGLLYTYYDAVMCHGVFEEYMSILSHKNPNAKILELGAGTGGATLPALQGLGGQNGQNPRFEKYVFTDISTGFFEEAQVKLKPWRGLIEYRGLNIENDPVDEGFTEGEYDVVIACLVLHATKNIDNTLRNTRKLLKPGGKLILAEISQALNQVFMMFGCLPGWWMAEEPYRKWGPCMNEEQWIEALKRNGFCEIVLSVPNNLDPIDEQGRVLSCVATEFPPPQTQTLATAPSPVVSIIADERSAALKPTIDAVRRQIELAGLSTCVQSLEETHDISLQGSFCLCLEELGRPVIRDMTQIEFETLQKITRESRGLLWVTSGACGDTKNPDLALIQGLARSLRCENEKFPLSTADFDPECTLSADELGGQLLVVLKDGLKESGPSECEYRFVSGCWQIKRCLETEEINKEIYQRIGHGDYESTTVSPQPVELGKTDRPLKLSITSPGLLDTLVFEDDPLPALKADEVEIDVRACGVNFRDIMICTGQLSDNSLGLECAGVVSKVGSGVSHLKVGERVTAWTYGNYRRLLNNPASMVQTIPDSMSFADAASIPIVYCTAIYGLLHIGRLRKGQTVLIHSAAGGVGQAAVAVAQLQGAEVFVTVGTQEKRELMRREFNIPDDHIFSSRGLSFARDLKKATHGRGVSVVLNSLAGEALSATWDCIAPFGSFIEMGKKDISDNRRLEMAPFKRNVTFASIDLITVFKQDLDLAAELLGTAMELIRGGKLLPIPCVSTFTFSQFEEAFRFMQMGKHVGKVVMTPTAQDVVQALPSPSAGVTFSPDATYVLSGGLGGLGRSMSRWMVSRGAKNLVFLSRSTPSSDAAQELLLELRDGGVVSEVVKTDITQASVLQSDLQSVLRRMPPIRGVVQAAMVLEDQIFENMSLEAFNAGIRPKVHGSWNLHEVMSDQPLDFFLMLASAVGVLGNPGQSNYAAANTYQDALAHYRTARGLPATVIDLGMILAIGKVAEDETGKKKRNLERQGFVGIDEEELISLLESALTVDSRSQSQCQIITGIKTQENQSEGDDLEPFWKSDPVFSHVKNMSGRTVADADDGQVQSIQALLQSAVTQEDSAAIILEAIISKLSRSLMVDRGEMDANRPTAAYGVDSLIAVEMRNWFQKELGTDVPVFEILQANSLMSLAMQVAEKRAALP